MGTRLTQYTLSEIVGVSCRLLLNGVPEEYIDKDMRMKAREFCLFAATGAEYQMPESSREDWMPPGRLPLGELFCVQTNARRDGTFFKNMFYLKQVELNRKPYIVGLQGEMPADMFSAEDPET